MACSSGIQAKKSTREVFNKCCCGCGGCERKKASKDKDHKDNKGNNGESPFSLLDLAQKKTPEMASEPSAV